MLTDYSEHKGQSHSEKLNMLNMEQKHSNHCWFKQGCRGLLEYTGNWSLTGCVKYNVKYGLLAITK